MMNTPFRVIDPVATGTNIIRLRKKRGLTVRDLQTYFGFEEPQAIYKWQRGQSLPTVDNLYALGALLDVPLDDILVPSAPKLNRIRGEQQAKAACCSQLFRTYPDHHRHRGGAVLSASRQPRLLAFHPCFYYDSSSLRLRH